MSDPVLSHEEIKQAREKILDDLRRARAFLHSASVLCGERPVWVKPCAEIRKIEAGLLEIEQALPIPVP